LTVVNHPITGPVLYSPHQTPFICETQASGLGEPLDADCSAATKVEYFYRSTAAPAPRENQGDLATADNANGFGGGRGNAPANPFKPLDPNAPRPADIAMTTTTEGRTVPYIVRREMGTINRAVYSFAFLHEPGTPLPSPWTGGAAWNGRLVYTFGGGVAWGYHQGRTIGGLNGNRGNLEDGQYGDFPVAKGFALAGSSLNVFGTYANDVVSAETMMMVKEHFVDQFGPIKWTIGSGRSGGSMQQHLIANNYPGLLDAIVPTASFSDVITFQTTMLDCEVLDRAMTASKQPFTTDQKTAVSGFSHWDYCTNNKLRYAAVAADINCDPQTVPPSMRFDPAKKTDGVRCTYQDAYVSVYGRDPKTGFARRPFDNTGVQYGLAAFNAGTINFNQFLDINRLAGGHDINGNLVAERTVADQEALRIAYESGRVNDGAHGLALIPIIDMRPYTEGPGGNVHDKFDGVHVAARPFRVRPHVDDGHQGQPVRAVVDAAALVGDAQRLLIGHGAFGNEVTVDVVAAGKAVDVEELVEIDRAGVEGREPVLDAGVVERPAREAGLGIPAVDADVRILVRAADAVGLLRGIEAHRWRDRLRIAVDVGGDRRIPQLVVRAVVPVAEAGDRRLLVGGERLLRGRHRAIEHFAVEHRRLEGDDVGKARGRHDRVEQPRVVVGDQVLLHRAAGPPAADRPLDRTELIDEVLFHHHHRLRGDDVVGVGAEDVERRPGERETLRDREVAVLAVFEVAAIAVEPADRAPLVVAPGDAAAEGVDEAPVPRGATRPRRGERRAGLVEERDRIDGAVDRAHLAPDDVGNRSALGGRRHGDVGGTRRVRVERLERVRGRVAASSAEAVRVVRRGEVALVFARRGGCRRAIEVLDLRCRGAVRVERFAEAARLRLADERRLVRTVEDRSGDRMVDDGQLRGRLAAAHRRLDGVGADVESGHEPDQGLVGGDFE